MDSFCNQISAPVMFLKPDPLYDEEKPYAIASDPPPGIKKSNIVNKSYETKITNTRGREQDFSLYTTGFEWVQQSLELSLKDEEGINRYMATMESFLKDHLCASNVIAYDYVIRQQRDQKEPRPPGVSRKIKKQILGAHLDISRESAIKRIKHKFEESAASYLLQSRWHIVNAWRPITGPVKSMPLTLCDSTTLAEDDIVASDIVLPHLQIEAYEIWYSPEQKWYYLKEQKTDEVLIMMSCDSETNTRCAHTAFEDPSTLSSDPRRESIEIRCMVFF